jgi:hypothetical protein
MVKYDLIRHELSVISSPGVRGAVAMELDDGALGFVAMLDRCIYRWSWQADANNGIGKWAEHMVMQLEYSQKVTQTSFIEWLALWKAQILYSSAHMRDSSHLISSPRR